MAGRQRLQRLIGKEFLHQRAEALVKLFSSTTGFGQKEAALLQVFFEHFFFAVTANNSSWFPRNNPRLASKICQANGCFLNISLLTNSTRLRASLWSLFQSLPGPWTSLLTMIG